MLANRCSLCYGAQRCQEIAVSEHTLPTLCMCDLNMHASPQHGVNLDYPREADAWEKCCSTCRTSIGLGPSGGKIGALALDSHISNVNVMFMSGELASAQRSWGAPLGNCRLGDHLLLIAIPSRTPQPTSTVVHSQQAHFLEHTGISLLSSKHQLGKEVCLYTR